MNVVFRCSGTRATLIDASPGVVQFGKVCLSPSCIFVLSGKLSLGGLFSETKRSQTESAEASARSSGKTTTEATVWIRTMKS